MSSNTRSTRRRLVAVLTVASLALAACSGGGDDNGSGGGNGGGNDGNGGSNLPECPIGAIDKAGGKPVTITLWHAMARENETTLQQLTKEFNDAQSDVVVKLVNQNSYGDNLTKYKAGLASGELPDLIQIEDTATQLMIDSQGVLPAQSCIEAETYDTSDFLPRVIAYYTVGDVLYPMPFNVSNPVLYYNKQAFEKAGLDPAKPPTTLDEVRADAQAIVDKKVTQFGFAIKTDAWYIEQWLGKAGQPYVNNDNGRTERATAVEFDSPAGQELFDWLGGMVTDKLAQSTGDSDVDHLLAIGNGSASMTVDTSAALGTIAAVLGSGQFPNVTLGVGPLPGPEGKGGALVGGAALYLMKSSSPEKQEAAWRFAKFLAEPEVQAKWAAGTGYVPIRASALDQKVLQDRWKSEPGFRVAYDQLVNGVENTASAGPVIGDYVGVRDAVRNALAEMFGGKRTPEAALARAAADANAAIETYNSSIGA